MVRLRLLHDNIHAMLLRSSAAALMLLALHGAPAATPAPSGVALIEGEGYPVCRAITAALRHLGPHVGPATWVARLPSVRGATQPSWTPAPNARANSDEALPHPGLIFGPAEETTIPGVVIETPPAMGTNTSVTIDLHLIRRAMQDDGTGWFSGIGGHPGQVLGWSFEAVNLTLFPGVTHVRVGIGLVQATVLLWGGQPWFGDGLGKFGTLEASPSLEPRDPAGFLIRQLCVI